MKPDKAIRKRTQIDNTNKTMFLWVAGVSVVVGISVVVSIFLGQILFFNEKVLIEKGKTISNLENNNKVVNKLKDEVKLLEQNQSLIDSKSDPTDKALQVILDALPSEANSLALGASLQNKLLFGIDGLNIESLSVEQVAGVETLIDSEATVDASADSSTLNQIRFRFIVGGSPEALLNVLTNLEKSIRTIHIDTLKIEYQNPTSLNLHVEGSAYYEPFKDIKLKDTTVK